MRKSKDFRATGIDYTWKLRQRGVTKHRLNMLVDQGLNGMISFTKVPMRLCMFFGFALWPVVLIWAYVDVPARKQEAPR